MREYRYHPTSNIEAPTPHFLNHHNLTSRNKYASFEMVSKHCVSTEENESTLIESTIQQKTQRRQQIARFVYDVWTQGGADVCGLAEPILVDERLDILSSYVIEYYTEGHEERSSSSFLGCADTSVIDDVGVANLSYHNFCENYMYPNIPVMIRGLSDTWECCDDWVMKDPSTGQSMPNQSHIIQHYGNDVITVHVQPMDGFQCPQQRPETSITYDMTVADYMKWWKNYELSEELLLYLKDWKFVASHPESDIYYCPHFFADDWLNDAKHGSYKFIYLGRKGTVTALHADVLRSFSWSTNIFGTKMWYFIAPQYAHLLYDCFGTNLAYHLHADIANKVDRNTVSGAEHEQNDFMSTLYPGLRYARQYAFSVRQPSGATLFVPSNWFHTVENIEDTLSINHNWMNGANIRKCWHYVESKVRRYEERANNEPLTNGATGRFDVTACGVDSTVGAVLERIDDDVQLVWEVVEKKASSYIQLDAGSLSSTQTHDLVGILFVVDGILSFYNDRNLHIDATKEFDKVKQLRHTIETILL